MDFFDGEKNIRNASIVGTILAIITLLQGIFVGDYYSMALSILILLIAVGIYYKSRVSAILLFLLFAVGKIMQLIYPEYYIQPFNDFIAVLSRLLAILVIFFLWMGVLGTFAYHKDNLGEGKLDKRVLIGLGVCSIFVGVVLFLFSLYSSEQASFDNDEVISNSQNNPTNQSLSEARKEFTTKLTEIKTYKSKVEKPPAKLLHIVQFPTAIGDMSAYLSNIPNDGRLHPAVIWITGGWGNDIGDVWKPRHRENDQSGSIFYRSGIVTMYPSQRGGNMNPGSDESGFGEVDDIIAAAEFLRKQKGIDTSRIYLVGHSTGGTKVLLVSECYHKFKAVFSFGPEDVWGYRNIYFDYNNERELLLRSPIYWLKSIQTPVYIIEGKESGGGWCLAALSKKAREEKNPYVKCKAVDNADHFTVLYPECERIAQQILDNTL